MSEDVFGLDEKEVKKQKEAQQKFDREKKLRINDLRKVLSTPEGRRTIWNELSRAKVFAPSFSLDSIQMAKNEGERSIGIALLADVMEAKAEAFYTMYTEAMSKKKSEERQEEVKEEDKYVD